MTRQYADPSTTLCVHHRLEELLRTRLKRNTCSPRQPNRIATDHGTQGSPIVVAADEVLAHPIGRPPRRAVGRSIDRVMTAAFSGTRIIESPEREGQEPRPDERSSDRNAVGYVDHRCGVAAHEDDCIGTRYHRRQLLAKRLDQLFCRLILR